MPTREAALKTAAMMDPHDLLTGGRRDDALVLLEEVELGVGRPDIIVLGVDLAALAIRRSAGLRLRNLTEARCLGAMTSGDAASAGVSQDHFRRTAARLAGLGWQRDDLSTVVSDSLLIEAKVEHWGKGLQQLSRVRWASHAAALLVPDDVAAFVPRTMLRHNEVGLLVQSQDRTTWRWRPSRVALPAYVDAWLGELAIRAVAC